MPAAKIFYFMDGVVRDGKGLALCHTAPCTHAADRVCCAACISLCFLSSYRKPALPRIADLHTPQERVLRGSADAFLGSGGHGGTLCAGVKFILPPPALKQRFPACWNLFWKQAAASTAHCPRAGCSQKQDMLIVELSMDLSQNKLVGGHRRLQKLLLLGVCLEQRQLCVVFREKMELKEPLSALDTHLEAAST